jgi:hypothetical protein
MCGNLFSHLVRDMFTTAIYLLQFQKVAYARERLHLVKGPNDLLKIRSRSVIEADSVDVMALDNKKIKFWELIFAQGKLAFGIRLV